MLPSAVAIADDLIIISQLFEFVKRFLKTFSSFFQFFSFAEKKHPLLDCLDIISQLFPIVKCFFLFFSFFQKLFLKSMLPIFLSASQSAGGLLPSRAHFTYKISSNRTIVFQKTSTDASSNDSSGECRSCNVGAIEIISMSGMCE